MNSAVGECLALATEEQFGGVCGRGTRGANEQTGEEDSGARTRANTGGAGALKVQRADARGFSVVEVCGLR